MEVRGVPPDVSVDVVEADAVGANMSADEGGFDAWVGACGTDEDVSGLCPPSEDVPPVVVGGEECVDGVLVEGVWGGYFLKVALCGEGPGGGSGVGGEPFGGILGGLLFGDVSAFEGEVLLGGEGRGCGVEEVEVGEWEDGLVGCKKGGVVWGLRGKGLGIPAGYGRCEECDGERCQEAPKGEVFAKGEARGIEDSEAEGDEGEYGVPSGPGGPGRAWGKELEGGKADVGGEGESGKEGEWA